MSGIETGLTPDQTNNGFVDLSAFYNAASPAAWNAANPGQTYSNPLEWMRVDQADGTLKQAGGLQIQNAGSAVAASELGFEHTNVICFNTGTMILTERGDVAVEGLQVGARVETMDHGFQTLRWIGARHLNAQDLARNEKLRPIRLSKDVVGFGARAIVVSLQHRILITSKVAQRMFGEHEVLVAAVKLLALDGVEITYDLRQVTYYHLLFDAHEITFLPMASPQRASILARRTRRA